MEKSFEFVSRNSVKQSSSNGYAEKFEQDGFWYKANVGAFNSHAEVVACRLSKYTNVNKCVEYSLIKQNNEYFTKSADFIKGRPFETLSSLHSKVTGTSIEYVQNTLFGEKLFTYVINFVKSAVKKDVTEDLVKILKFDAFVLNEDRHFKNLALLLVNNQWEIFPMYDFDCALFSCIEDLDNLPTEHKSLPFFFTHNEQLRFLNKISNFKLIVKPFNPQQIIDNLWDKEYTIGNDVILAYLETVKGGLTL
ncbi:MAG: HipA domain-containing protein [Firmicutes bacterium]|nr:HipA domain-containing protein [Bacillota bacterium]